MRLGECAAPVPNTTNEAVRRFFRTPKGLLLIVLVILVALAAPREGITQVAPGLASAVIVAAIMDVVALRWTRDDWEFPSGAVLTGLLVAMVLTPQEPWYVGACTSAAAIGSKYAFRTRSANIFNPAALALVVTFYVFHTGQSWWGALPELSSLALAVLFGTGAFIADRVNKIPLVLIFLGTYFALFTITAFERNAGNVAEIFRSPDLHAVLFFAFFILTDPPTSPVKYPDQVLCGVIVAIVSFVVFEWLGVAYYLLAGVLAGNIWEAWHRGYLYSRRHVSSDPNTRAIA
jgi:Na+-translocating ferredoxin:NAD+ oxidoreductase RnfD subunit